MCLSKKHYYKTYLHTLLIKKKIIMSKKRIKNIAIVIGSLIGIIAIAGGYFYSIIPKPAGPVPALQSELFEPPKNQAPPAGKFIYKSATELAALIKNKQATSVEIVKDIIAYIKYHNHKYNAIVWLLEDQALKDAVKADSLLAHDSIMGPLHGVPITVKEQFSVRGSYLTLNAKMIGGFKPASDQAVVNQLKKSGAIIIGTTNVPHMLMDYQTQGEIYPTASNPYDTSRTPGGSTGGGAASLAAGFVPLELGGDMGGSIRVPSSFCGLYGLKTTELAIEIWDQEFPGMEFDTKNAALAVGGPLARNPADLELMWNVLKETPNQLLKSMPYEYDTIKSLNEYNIAWYDALKFGEFQIPVHHDIKIKLSVFLDSLTLHGVKKENTMPNTFSEQFQIFMGLMAYMNTYGQPWIIRKFIVDGFKKMGAGPIDLSKAYDLAMSQDKNKHKEFITQRKIIIAEWEKFFMKYDFLICPVMPMPAIKKCPMGSAIDIDGIETNYWVSGSYALMVNALGLPSITIPLGLNDEGLPIGVQVVGKYFSEPQLIHFAKLLESITPGFIKPKEL